MMPDKNKINVMVTGVGGGGHGEQILKALQLASTDYEIVGCDMSPTSKSLLEVHHPYLAPPADAPDYIPCILAICKKHNVQALFHGSEAELKAMSHARKKIEDTNIFLPINPGSVIDTCMDKFKTMKFLAEQGFLFPETIKVSSPEDIEKINFLPAVLKPSIGGGASVNLFLAQTKKELYMFSEYLSSIYSEFIVQQYVGTADSEYTVGILISMDGELLNSIAVKRHILSSLSNRIKIKNRTGNTKFGPILVISSGISQGEIGRFPEVTKPCEKIAMAMGCRGAVNIQCRMVDGKIYVFEINPRFSGTTSLRAMVGYNEPDILIRKHLLGENIKPNFTYKSGLIVRGLEEKFINNFKLPDGRDLL
jgi:carbamoyl-phosphate synthase large subunit